MSQLSHAPEFTLPSLTGTFHLANSQNRDRIALLFARDDAIVRSAIAQVEQSLHSWQDRDLILVLVLPPQSALHSESHEPPNVSITRDENGEVARLFHVANGETQFFLLGKSGFPVALSTTRFPTDAELFALIDAMPMRQREMRQKSS